MTRRFWNYEHTVKCVGEQVGWGALLDVLDVRGVLHPVQKVVIFTWSKHRSSKGRINTVQFKRMWELEACYEPNKPTARTKSDQVLFAG